ncbi:hypothetical protein [uncultured Litoreibacter sp.]|uniref:hypothetical protein n=1 Tax=uncultured Litoreibacter sp. TaxID=1392394 RepID=UPI00262ABE6E|nr:hypothetical protein [uncultured Litoreibacter sp.]
MRHIFLAALLSLPANAAFADNLERLEVATELGGKHLSAFILSRAPELEPNLPNWDWDDDYRTAARCFLDDLEDSQGADHVEKYLTAVEEYSATPVTSLAQTENQPAIMSTPAVMTAMQSCGVMQQVMKRMQESGFMGAMMNEATMSKLGG